MKNINKTNKYSSILSLGILVIATFTLAFNPGEANAQYNYVSKNLVYVDDSKYNPSPESGVKNNAFPSPTFGGNSNKNTNNNSSGSTNTSKNTSSNTTSVNTATSAKDQSGNTATNTTSQSSNKTIGSKLNSLAAGALFGDTGFVPSGLIQWIMIAILILIIVILARKIFGAEKRYLESPLKHA